VVSGRLTVSGPSRGEPLLGLLEAGQHGGFGVAAAQHGEQGIEGLMELGELLKAASPAQGNELCKRDVGQVVGTCSGISRWKQS
jgi:hypothetical protein